MRRRDLSPVLFAAAVGSGALSKRAQAQTCSTPCFAPTAAEGAAKIVPINTSYPEGVVERYGAMGDGTTDDTSAWSKALSININITTAPSRMYKITETLSIPQGITVDLNGSTLLPFGAVDGFTLEQSIFQLRNGVLDLTNTSGRGLYAPSAIQQFLIENIIIRNSTGTAVQMQDCYTGTLRNVRVETAAGRSVLLFSSIPGIPINSIWIERLSAAGSTYNGNVVEVQGASGVYFVNCDWQNNTGGPLSTDLRIDSTINAGITQVVVQSSYFEHGVGIAGSCVYLGDPGTGTNAHVGVRLVACYFQTSKQMVRIGQYVNDDCTLRDCCFMGASGGPSNAISVAGSPYPRIIECTGSLSSVQATGRTSIGGARWSYGSGDPNGVLAGNPGELYSSTAGGSGATVYVKESGVDTNTGWTAK